MDARSLLFKLKDAFNLHDMESFSDCFHEDYDSEQPAHPGRSFQGRKQAVKNWAGNFTEMPDFTAELVNYAITENT